MDTEPSRRRFLLALGCVTSLVGCSQLNDDPPNSTSDGAGRQSGSVPRGPARGPRSDAGPEAKTLSNAWNREGTPEPTSVVAADGSTEYQSFEAAYGDARPGEVIGIAPGDYTMGQLETQSADAEGLTYETVDTRGCTVVGKGRSASRLTFETESDVLSLPGWEFWLLTVDAGGSVIGPRDGKHRGDGVTSPIMKPPAYPDRGTTLEPGDYTLTGTGLDTSKSVTTTRLGVEFDTVVDAVEDLGLDNTGSEPIGDAFDDAYESGTLVEFPPGQYRVDELHQGNNVSRFGIRGAGTSRRDVQFVPTSGVAVKWLKAVGAGPHLLENFSVNERSDDASQLSVWLRTSGGSVIKNVEWLGRTPDDSELGYSLTAEVTDEDGIFVVDGLTAGLDEAAKSVQYPDGVEFLRAGPNHRGEVLLRDPVIHERNSNAVRYTAGPGVLTVEGGELVNNQNANLRFGPGDHPSKVSSATGTYIRIDDSSTGSVDALRLSSRIDGRSGSVLRGLDIEWTKSDGRGVITVPEFGGHGSAGFYDCYVHNDGDLPTVDADPVSISSDAIVFQNCIFTGSGGGFDAGNRSGSVIRNSCVSIPDVSYGGFDTENVSSNCNRSGRPKCRPMPTITVTSMEGLTVDLSAADSTDRDGKLVAFEWDVEGTSYNGPTVSHTFRMPGTYSIRLAVRDDAGRSVTTSTEVIVDYPALV